MHIYINTNSYGNRADFVVIYIYLKKGEENMKKLLSVLLALTLILSVAPLGTDAHNGARDELGGHFAAKTGTYHFHEKSSLLMSAKSKQEVVNLIKKYNSNASTYNVSVNSIDWTTYTATGYTSPAGKTFKEMYSFTPSGSSSPAASSTTKKKTTTNSVSNTTAAGKVYSVVDGDTIKVKMTSGVDKGQTVTVRLSDIDTPETVHPTKPVQKYGKEASNRTRKLLPKNTTIKLVYEAQGKDQYGRHTAFVYKGNTNINVTLVKEGLARVDYTYAKKGEKYYNSLRSAESVAKKAKKNIWSIKGYVNSKFMGAS